LDDNFDNIIGEIEGKEKQIVEKVEKVEEKQITLILNNNVIEYRKSDGYVNATQLCRACGKLFGHWYTLETTKKIISILASNIGNPILDLVDIKIDGKHEDTWIHPDLAIQLAQWLNPEFALQVSHWIRTLFIEGKVEANIKLLKEKDNEIKYKDKRIKHLEQRILKKISIPKYDDSKFVVYLATNEHSEKKRKYTVGLANDLSKRISSYNKLEDAQANIKYLLAHVSVHYPIYYKSFKDEEQMEVAEKMVLNKLYDYRMLESKDRFKLPLGKDIKLFTKAIDDTFIFFNN
jgi:hypothetical protein